MSLTHTFTIGYSGIQSFR